MNKNTVKHYCLAMINKDTGEIEHIATSNAPLSDEAVGKPQNWENTHYMSRFEFDEVPPKGRQILSAREVLKRVAANKGNLP